MGLDMYLTGEIFFMKPRRRGQLKVKLSYDLGYWRKHPNLHGYIVQTFADGDDSCQQIHLSADDLRKIIAAVKAKELPETTGFFFGQSDGTEWRDDVRIFRNAVDWLETEEANQRRSVYYQASW
jgi:hypothetical protein